jgi:hypothetical protein
VDSRGRYLVLGALLVSATLAGGCARREPHRHHDRTGNSQDQYTRWPKPNRSHERQHVWGDHVRYVEDDGILE